jgi:hypothetical protein
MIFLAVSFCLFVMSKNHRQIAAHNLMQTYLFIILLIGIIILLNIFTTFSPERKIFRKICYILILLTASIEYIYYANVLLSFSSQAYSYPNHQLISQVKQFAGLNRVTGFWDSKITTNLATHYRFYSPEGYNPLHYRWTQELVAASRTDTDIIKLQRSDVDIDPDRKFNSNRFMDLTSTRYVTAAVTNPNESWETEPLKYSPEYFRLIWQNAGFKIYERNSALPRVGLYRNYRTIESAPERLKVLFDQGFDPMTSVILSQPLPQEISGQATGSATMIDYQANRVLIDTQTTGGNLLLLLTDTFAPDWQAFLDGKRITIYQANHAFRAVIIPAGSHRLRFSIFWP